MIDERLSHFRILDRLGEGGMGVVYRAVDEVLRRTVALKVLPPELLGDAQRRRRLLREAQAAAAVTHPHIVEPAELLRRLAALVPAPYANMVRYHGVFASRSRWRSRLPPPGNEEAAAAIRELETEGKTAAMGPRAEGADGAFATASTPSGPTAASGRGDEAEAVDLPPPELAGAHQPRRRPLPWAQLLM
ncbi:MAG: transposase, partial [Candidatus Eiseniibacteriota bacterium]